MYPHPQSWRPLALLSALVSATLFATATVTVAPGDTLSQIAERNDVSIDDLIAWNDIDDPDRIFAGSTLIVSAPEAATTGTPSGETGTHVVTAGDTLSAIASRFGTSVAALVAANDLADPDRIRVGQRLTLSTTPATTTTVAARTHTVVAGDTLSSIAEAYDVKTGVLATDNDIADPDRIRIGMVLTIGAPAPAPAPAAPATTTAPTITEPANPTPSTSRAADEVLLTPIFAQWAEIYDVPRDLVEAIAWKGSDWTPDAVGADGHLGIMQLSPDTVQLIEGGLLGRDMDALDASDGIQMGARFLRYLLDRTDSEREAVAAWVQGLNGVRTNGVSAAGAGYVDAIEEIRRQRA